MATITNPSFRKIGQIGEAFFWIISLNRDYPENRLASPTFFPMFDRWYELEDENIIIVHMPSSTHARIVQCNIDFSTIRIT